jgi:DNA polymerase V
MQKLMALVDCNNFYASCERIFQPKLEGKPIVILSNNDGCIVSRSNEAKVLGIPMGAPYHEWKHELQRHRVTVFSSNYALYGDMSRRVMDILSRYAPHQEIYSIDESFLDFTGIANPEAHAATLRADIRKCTGIPVAVGLGTTKTLAKLANYCAKKRSPWLEAGVCNLSALAPEDLGLLLDSIPVGEIWGVGYRTAPKLETRGIRTVRQLARADSKALRKSFGVVMERIIAELNGIPCLELEEVCPDKQQILSSRSFGELISDLPNLEAAIANHVSHGVEKLRHQHSKASLITVFIRTSPFRRHDPQYSAHSTVTLTVPTNDIGVFQKTANQGLQRIYKAGFRYQKAGVILQAIEPELIRQADLFADPPDERREQLLKTLDQINRQYGRETLRTATELLGTKWHMRQALRSARYTTCWEELPWIG